MKYITTLLNDDAVANLLFVKKESVHIVNLHLLRRIVLEEIQPYMKPDLSLDLGVRAESIASRILGFTA